MAEDAVVERTTAPVLPARQPVRQSGRVAGATPDRARMAWPDAAKAACILLVVLGHVTYLHVEGSRWYEQAGAPPVWNALDVVLRPVRMPLFFTVSGFFAARAITRPWAASSRARVGQNLYLHVLWMLIGFGVSAAVGLPTFMAPADAAGLPAAALTASTGLWYLYALALYFVLARVTRRLPAPVPVGAAAVLAVVSFSGLLPGSGDTHSVLENLVWFLAGARFPHAVRTLSSRPRPVLLAGLVAVLVVVLGAVRVLDLPVVANAVLEIPTRAGAIVAGVLVAVLAVTRFPRACAPLLRLGRRTLPVYVLHGIALMVLQRPLAAVTEPLFGAVPHAGQLLLVLVYPVALTLGMAWLCLALQTLAQRTGVGWLFALPGSRRPPAGAQ